MISTNFIILSPLSGYFDAVSGQLKKQTDNKLRRLAFYLLKIVIYEDQKSDPERFYGFQRFNSVTMHR